MTDSINRDFELIEDPKEAQALLKLAAQEVCAVIVWSKNDGGSIESIFSQYSDIEEAVFVAIPADLDQRAFVEKLAKNQSRECLLSLSTSRATLFLKTDFLGFDPIGMKFRKPIRIFRVQRRKSLRYVIPSDCLVNVEFKDPLIETDTHSTRASDISTGGLSFFVDATAATSLTEGLMLKGMKISLGNQEIAVDAEVRYVRRETENLKKRFKIGVQFHQLQAKDQDYIGAYVLEGTRKYLSSLA